MLNEGIIFNDTKALMKTEMLKQLRKLETTDPDHWERAVFESMTGHTREEVDWEFEDNKAGYYTWVKSFDGLINELIEDGYVGRKQNAQREWVLSALETDDPITFSYQTYPTG